jgi:Response regulators consisting of a CheY-like receiver domain and a winged-helix DNA-binding domain
MDCLVTDMHMPGMNGLELQRELQRKGIFVPVILLTAFPTDEARLVAAELGIADFVPKPTDPEALLERVTRLVRR